MDLRVFRITFVVLVAALVFLLAGFPPPPGLTGPVVHGASVSTGWPMNNQTYEGVRYSSLHQINADNVRQMRQICALRLREVGPFQAGPVVIGTTMYVTTAHDTYAMNAGTCGVIWHDVYAPSGL